MSKPKFKLTDHKGNSLVKGYFLWFSDAEDYAKERDLCEYRICLQSEESNALKILFSTYRIDNMTKEEKGLFAKEKKPKYDHKQIKNYIGENLSDFDFDSEKYCDYFPKSGIILYRCKDREEREKVKSDILNNTILSIKELGNANTIFIINRHLNRFIMEPKKEDTRCIICEEGEGNSICEACNDNEEVLDDGEESLKIEEDERVSFDFDEL